MISVKQEHLKVMAGLTYVMGREKRAGAPDQGGQCIELPGKGVKHVQPFTRQEWGWWCIAVLGLGLNSWLRVGTHLIGFFFFQHPFIPI